MTGRIWQFFILIALRMASLIVFFTFQFSGRKLKF